MVELFADVEPVVRETQTLRVSGRIKEVAGLTLAAEGMRLPVGSLCEIQRSARGSVPAQVVGARDDCVVLVPLVEPSGIALLDDGRVIVGETSVDGGTEAALVTLSEGSASVLTRGLRSGYPFGIALSPDQSAVIISAVDKDSWNDAVYTVPVAGGAVTQVTEFEQQLSAAGLKESERVGTYAWASTSQNGGTVYTVVAR